MFWIWVSGVWGLGSHLGMRGCLCASDKISAHFGGRADLKSARWICPPDGADGVVPCDPGSKMFRGGDYESTFAQERLR